MQSSHELEKHIPEHSTWDFGGYADSETPRGVDVVHSTETFLTFQKFWNRYLLGSNPVIICNVEAEIQQATKDWNFNYFNEKFKDLQVVWNNDHHARGEKILQQTGNLTAFMK